MTTMMIVDESRNSEFKKNLTRLLNLLHISFEEVDYNFSGCDFLILNSENCLGIRNVDCSCCLVNMDRLINKGSNIEGVLVTFGFGSKNTVTVSSVEEESGEFVYCLQRFIELKTSLVLEPQEVPIFVEDINEDVLYAYMTAITIALIEGIKPIDIKLNMDCKKYRSLV